ncbi:hypothetical protein HLB23_06760 [Nocardia uniformis]|uniref:Secreted protein n=1 Tax=Nocardia uniformis TaxID=53432 RepID=A0A849BZA1_9NOCA|nr:hypothetical protein [Nocardia uniformis]NNH69570.1 hypothetical protein [Nocardia uniformis]
MIARCVGLAGVACASLALISGCSGQSAEPGEDDREIAAADASNQSRSVFVTACGGTAAGWQASGVVSNRDDVEHRYAVVVSFITPESTVLERTRTEVLVPPGATENFTTETLLDPVRRPETVKCVLRDVEQL